MAEKKIKIQDYYEAALDDSSILTFDIQTDLNPTNRLLHKQSRFLYVVSGYAKIRIQNEIHEMKPGVVIAILPWQISQIIEVVEEVTYYLLIYNFNLLNHIVKRDLNITDTDVNFIDKLYQNNSVLSKEDTSKKIKSIFDDIKDEIGICSMDMLSKNNSYSTLYLQSKLVELLVMYLRLIDSAQPVHNKDLNEQDIFKYMYLNSTKNLSLETLSKVFLMSESSISKYINQMTGLGFYDLLHEMRLSKAQFLLLHTNLTLKDIASAVKYADPSQLSKVFSEKRGISTRRFKQANDCIDSLVNVRLDHRSAKIIEYIYDNYSEDIDIVDISNEFNISPKSINKILVYYMEQNFRNFLTQVRIYKSCSLLLETDYSITEIASIVGFNSTKTFNRHFMKHILVTPSEFRKTTLEQNDDNE